MAPCFENLLNVSLALFDRLNQTGCPSSEEDVKTVYAKSASALL